MTYYLNQDVIIIHTPNEKKYLLYDRAVRTQYEINEDMFILLSSIYEGDLQLCDEVDQQIVLEDLLTRNILVSQKQNRYNNIKVLRCGELSKLTLEITDDCNLHCRHCYGDFGTKSTYLDLERIDALLCQAAQAGVYEISITGGEPLMHPLFSKIVDLCYEYGMLVTVFSNLTLLDSGDEMIVSSFAKVYKVITSIESTHEEVHDCYRGGAGSLKRTLNAIDLLKKFKVPITVNLVIGPHNYLEIKQIIEFIQSKALSMVVDITSQEGRAINLDLDERAILKAFEQVKTNVQISSNILDGCGVGKRFLYIRADGSIALCPSIKDAKYKYGNINFVYDLLRIANEVLSSKGITCREFTNKCNCSGGCRARAYHKHGDLEAPDMSYCQLFKYET